MSEAPEPKSRKPYSRPVFTEFGDLRKGAILDPGPTSPAPSPPPLTY